MSNQSAIYGAVAGGVVSLIVSLCSIYVRHKLNKRQKKQDERDDWYRNLISEIRETRRFAMRLSPDIVLETKRDGSPIEDDTGDLRVLGDCIRSVEQHQDSMPPELKGTQIDSQLSSLISTYREIGQSDEADIFYLQMEVIEECEKVLDCIEEYHDRSENLY